MTKRKVNNNKKKHYVDKEELRDEIERCKNAGEVSDELAEMFMKITQGVSYKFSNLSYYGILEDVKQDCLCLLLRKYNNIDVSRGTSCFSYVTTCVYNHMRYQLGKAKKYKDRIDLISETVRDHVQRIERENL